MNNQKKILMLFIEPTPYLLNLINILEKECPYHIDVVFIKSNFTQQWRLQSKHCVLDKQSRQFSYLFRQFFFKKKYDLIFLAGWSQPTTLFFMFCAKLHRIPIVVDSDTNFVPHTSYYKRIIKRIIYPLLFKLPNHFLPGGTRQSKYLEHYSVPKHKITIEKMTVDIVGQQQYYHQLPSHFRTMKRSKLGLTNKDFVFLFIGRLIERKGVLDLIDSFSEIKHVNAKCIIAGDGPLQSTVEAAAKNNPNIIYAGWMENQALLDLYYLSDVFVLPAHWEPWGLVINEALAAGKPVIVSDQVGCIDDLVIPSETGKIFPALDAHALTQCMTDFLINPKQCESYSKNAHALISQWTLQDQAKQMCEVWQRLIQSAT
ncbi:MAG: hypothetical protein A3F11_08410 [Gammaproteobacteria bacterium RIFCSPHIGHO2_12_FULL_37_14]|nr:MAG: hypothetical protein A3F11_08410 [Gammaproteobacteria bacterium RIFCSPHIGHO2_12_FULL_37_14]